MEHFIYVCIDPRNYEEFHYGKGNGSRKDVHLTSISDSETAVRIAAIHAANLRPIIRVIIRDLSENEALLIEETLLWKLGKQPTDASPGHHAEKFRPPDKMHLELSGFDFRSGVYCFNIGDGPNRLWVDSRKFGFISAEGETWVESISGFREGDIVAAYLKGKGFVGIGLITAPAAPIRDVKIDNKLLLELPLVCRKMGQNIDSDEKCEYVALVRWIATVSPEAAKWKPNLDFYITPPTRASLDDQPDIKAFLQSEFRVNFRDLAQWITCEGHLF